MISLTLLARFAFDVGTCHYMVPADAAAKVEATIKNAPIQDRNYLENSYNEGLKFGRKNYVDAPTCNKLLKEDIKELYSK